MVPSYSSISRWAHIHETLGTHAGGWQGQPPRRIRVGLGEGRTAQDSEQLAGEGDVLSGPTLPARSRWGCRLRALAADGTTRLPAPTQRWRPKCQCAGGVAWRGAFQSRLQAWSRTRRSIGAHQQFTQGCWQQLAEVDGGHLHGRAHAGRRALALLVGRWGRPILAGWRVFFAEGHGSRGSGLDWHAPAAGRSRESPLAAGGLHAAERCCFRRTTDFAETPDAAETTSHQTAHRGPHRHWLSEIADFHPTGRCWQRGVNSSYRHMLSDQLQADQPLATGERVCNDARQQGTVSAFLGTSTRCLKVLPALHQVARLNESD